MLGEEFLWDTTSDEIVENQEGFAEGLTCSWPVVFQDFVKGGWTRIGQDFKAPLICPRHSHKSRDLPREGGATGAPTPCWDLRLGLVVVTPGDIARVAHNGRAWWQTLEAQLGHYRLSSDFLTSPLPLVLGRVVSRPARHSEWRHWGQGVGRQDRALLQMKCDVNVIWETLRGCSPVVDHKWKAAGFRCGNGGKNGVR